MSIGIPVGFSFLTVILILSIFIVGPVTGPRLMIRSLFDTMSAMHWLTIPQFVLMGQILFVSGVAQKVLDAVSQWFGIIPGRLSLITVMGGTLFGVLSGSALATTASLGSLLAPDMQKRGYSKVMTAGPILAAGGMAMVLPPSAVAIIVGTIGDISIGRLLIGGIVPGVVLAIGNLGYILIRCAFKPDEAPRYKAAYTPWKDRFVTLFKDVIPLMSLLFLVIGTIFWGVATPNEAASLGCAGAFLIVVLKNKLNISVILNTLKGTASVTGMIFFIIAGAAGFTQLLNYTGATRSFVEIFLNLPVSDILIVVFMLFTVILLGCVMEPTSILMIVLPLYMPLIHAMGYNPVWFGLMLLITMDLANITPPFGLALFVLKGTLPKSFSMVDVYKSSLPFALVDLSVIIFMMAYPPLFVFLPNMM